MRPYLDNPTDFTIKTSYHTRDHGDGLKLGHTGPSPSNEAHRLRESGSLGGVDERMRMKVDPFNIIYSRNMKL